MGKKISAVEVRRPAHVPVELVHLWKAAARTAAKQKKILTASGTVNYLSINKIYRNMLAAHAHAATLEGRKASRVAAPMNWQVLQGKVQWNGGNELILETNHGFVNLALTPQQVQHLKEEFQHLSAPKTTPSIPTKTRNREYRSGRPPG